MLKCSAWAFVFILGLQAWYGGESSFSLESFSVILLQNLLLEEKHLCGWWWPLKASLLLLALVQTRTLALNWDWNQAELYELI
jgi:hypothetical protein